jgi:hypothetical protein
MDGSVQDVDAQRARWTRYRASQALTVDAGGKFGCGGLGSYVDSLEARLLFLPSDPYADVVPLDQETLGWLKELERTPEGGRQRSWHRERATSTALVRYDVQRDDATWTRYLALHRHGGIEAGMSRVTYKPGEEVRAFSLRSIIGLAWMTAALQAKIAGRWRIQMPFELTLALLDTRGATLGDLAEGWQNPGPWLGELPTCLENDLLLRIELDDPIDPDQCATRLGDRVERAFGSLDPRHIACVGQYEGRVDPRAY